MLDVGLIPVSVVLSFSTLGLSSSHICITSGGQIVSFPMPSNHPNMLIGTGSTVIAYRWLLMHPYWPNGRQGIGCASSGVHIMFIIEIQKCMRDSTRITKVRVVLLTVPKAAVAFSQSLMLSTGEIFFGVDSSWISKIWMAWDTTWYFQIYEFAL